MVSRMAFTHKDDSRAGSTPVVVDVGLLDSVQDRRVILLLGCPLPFDDHVGATDQLGSKVPPLTPRPLKIHHKPAPSPIDTGHLLCTADVTSLQTSQIYAGSRMATAVRFLHTSKACNHIILVKRTHIPPCLHLATLVHATHSDWCVA